MASIKGLQRLPRHLKQNFAGSNGLNLKMNTHECRQGGLSV
jgi:hypothetical protein